MADPPRQSERNQKPLRKEGFVYECDTRSKSKRSECRISDVNTGQLSAVAGSVVSPQEVCGDSEVHNLDSLPVEESAPVTGNVVSDLNISGGDFNTSICTVAINHVQGQAGACATDSLISSSGSASGASGGILTVIEATCSVNPGTVTSVSEAIAAVSTEPILSSDLLNSKQSVNSELKKFSESSVEQGVKSGAVDVRESSPNFIYDKSVDDCDNGSVVDYSVELSSEDGGDSVIVSEVPYSFFAGPLSETRDEWFGQREPFLSVSSAVYSDASGMSIWDSYLGSQQPPGSLSNPAATASATSSGEPAGSEIVKALSALSGHVSQLSLQVQSLSKEVSSISKENQELRGKIVSLEGAGFSDGGGRSDPSSRSVRPKDPKVTSGRYNRVEEEKARQAEVVREKIRSRSKHKKSAKGDRSGTEGDKEESSDEEEVVDLKSLKKRMSKSEQEYCELRVAQILKEAGGSFPEDEDSSSSGTSASSRSSHSEGKSKKKKLKSGSKVKTRPVKRQELRPHTVLCEDKGEVVEADAITLAKFLSCFMSITLLAGKKEAAGWSTLLAAISKILEFCPWTEARTFHNVVVLKIEQGRLHWSSDFMSLAEDFLNEKLREKLRSAKPSGAGSQSYRNGSRGSGRGAGQPFRSNRSKGLYAMVCRQWNYGTCQFGDRCKKWHVCWSCADSGKPGERHKAVSHNSSGSAGGAAQEQGR